MIGLMLDWINNRAAEREHRRLKQQYEDTMRDDKRKDYPIATGLVDYFPQALQAITAVSMEGARKHGTFNAAGYPTWDRSKSADDADALARHFIDRGKFDIDGHRHSAKVAWRALAVLEKELDAAAIPDAKRDSGNTQNAMYDDMAGIALANIDKAADKAKGAVLGLDLGKAGGDKTVYVLYGDSELSLEECAGLVNIPIDQILDMREGPMPSGAALTDAESFGMWLTTQPAVRVGGSVPVYDMIAALDKWKKLTAASKPPIPPGIWWCATCGTFHAIANLPYLGPDAAGFAFHKAWYDRRAEFPRTSTEAKKVWEESTAKAQRT